MMSNLKKFTVPINPEGKEEEFQLAKFTFNTLSVEFYAIDMFVENNNYSITLLEAKNCCHRMSNLLYCAYAIYNKYEKYVPFKKTIDDMYYRYEMRWQHPFEDKPRKSNPNDYKW